MNTRIWKVTGYLNWASNYHEGVKDNLDLQIEVDKSVTKDELEALLKYRYRDRKSVVLDIKEVYGEPKDKYVDKDGYPREEGYYYVKIGFKDNIFMEDKYLWNGSDFVLGIGRPFTNEVVAWRKCED